MLQKLSIRNYALIDSLEMDFRQGLTVMTGETGAGKSIILGALSLILGQRADAKLAKDATQKTVVEGVFDISRYALKSIFERDDIDYDDTTILRREILPSGKSRSFINDTPVSLSLMREIGAHLIDIHSQHQNLILSDNRFQLNMIDMWAEDKSLFVQYLETYNHYKKLLAELSRLEKVVDESRKEEEYIRFQYNQLYEAALQKGESALLEEEQETLSHAEEIKSSLYSVIELLDGEDVGVVARLKEVTMALRSLQRVFSAAEPIHNRLESSLIELRDILSELESHQERVAVDPERLRQVEQRLDMLYSLQHKHRTNTIDALIELRDELESRLHEIDTSDENILQLRKNIKLCETDLEAVGKALSVARHDYSDILTEKLIQRAMPLGMPHLSFEVEWTPKEKPDADGVETVRFLFSANKNRPLQPISEVASGGEISRLMLTLKSLAAEVSSMPTIIFDEIDTGVSGEIADKMGQIMADMAQNMQVIAITHLPQVASRGSQHYRIFKNDEGDTTHTCIEWLDNDKRVQEIARMLSGAQVTEAAVTNARELLNRK